MIVAVATFVVSNEKRATTVVVPDPTADTSPACVTVTIAGARELHWIWLC